MVLATFFISAQQKIVGEENFISIVAEDYRNLFTAELYKVLAFLVVIDYVLTNHEVKTQNITITISSNCKSILDTLYNTSPVINQSKYLYQVVREIHFY